MSLLDLALADFIDGLESSNNELGMRAAASRFAGRLGFRWFAYLGFSKPALKVLSSYPLAWSRHYIDQRYETIDPVIGRARSSRNVFQWDRRAFSAASRPQRKFLAEASEYQIRSGISVPIDGGFGRLALFTLATDAEAEKGSLPIEIADTVHLAGFYYHSHVYAKLQLALRRSNCVHLTQRELECLTWAARGKNMAETALILDISTRTVVFHLENARTKLDASNVTQAAFEAQRLGLIAF